MTEAIHVIAGATIGSYTKKAWFSFVLGVASHFILDAIPHWSFHSDDEQIFFSGLVFSATFILLIFFVPKNGYYKKTILAGIIGAILPDLFELTLIYFLPQFQKNLISIFHHYIQTEISPLSSIPLQIVLFFIFLYLIYRAKKSTAK